MLTITSFVKYLFCLYNNTHYSHPVINASLLPIHTTSENLIGLIYFKLDRKQKKELSAIQAMAGIINGCVSSSVSSSPSWTKMRNPHRKKVKTGGNGGFSGGGRRFQVNCVMNTLVASDPYAILRIHRGASESEVKKAFRTLALQYHPDVCRGSDCGVEFHQINEAYNTVMNDLECARGVEIGSGSDQEQDLVDPDWDLWEEWMGWEGAGTGDYSSHINPYI